jgi:hypothetical protein
LYIGIGIAFFKSMRSTGWLRHTARLPHAALLGSLFHSYAPPAPPTTIVRDIHAT